jgi:hypothetical protein
LRAYPILEGVLIPRARGGNTLGRFGQQYLDRRVAVGNLAHTVRDGSPEQHLEFTYENVDFELGIFPFESDLRPKPQIKFNCRAEMSLNISAL